MDKRECENCNKIERREEREIAEAEWTRTVYGEYERHRVRVKECEVNDEPFRPSKIAKHRSGEQAP